MAPLDGADPAEGANAASGQLRVVIATRIYTPEVAAAAFRLRALANALAEVGATVSVVTSRAPKSSLRVPPIAGVAVSRFPVLRDRSGNIRGYLQYLSFDAPLFFRLLFSPADVFVAEPPPTTGTVVALVGALRRRPFVYYAADIWTDALASTSAPRVVVTVMRALESFALRRADAVLAVSEEVAQRARDFGATSVHTVGNGVDTEIFTPEARDDDRSHERATPVFVYAGTMSEWQGAEVFLEAFALIADAWPSAELHVLGQGTRLDSMRSLGAEISGDRIRFHGLVSADETATWLRTATAALVSITPGQGYDFAKPTKLYAAAACGTPVIFAGTGAAKDLINSTELGLAVPHSAEAVAEAMRQLIKEQTAGRTAKLSRARAEWARDNASLIAVGDRASSTILSIASNHTKGSIA